MNVEHPDIKRRASVNGKGILNQKKTNTPLGDEKGLGFGDGMGLDTRIWMESFELASQFISEDGGVDWLLFLGGENDIRIYDNAMCCKSYSSYLGTLVAAISPLHIPIMSL
jgi:hypothetical protein